MHRLSFTIITYLFSILCLCGKNSHYSYTQLSINEGLSQANVEAILLDQRGDLWVGTKNGLNHYTQQEMKNYFHRLTDKNSLPHSRVHHLEEDSLGNIWAGTVNGLVMYDREHKHFHTMTRGTVKASFCIPGGVLFGGDNALYFYRYDTQELERIHIHPEGPNTHPIEYRVQKIIPFKEDVLLIGTRKKGLYTYDCRNREIKPFAENLPHFLLFSIYQASNQSLYVSFYGHGVYRLDLQGNLIQNYTTYNSSLSNNYVMDIMEHDGKLWLATDGGGINMIDLETEQFSHLTHITGDKTSLPANSITKLYKDYHNNLWVGSVTAGVFTVKNSYIKTYQDVAMNNPNGLTERTVASIYEEEDGLLWIGTDGGGMNLYDPKKDRFTHYPDTYGDKVISITGFSDDELLVSLYTKGLFTFNKKTGKYKRFIIVDKETDHKECYYGYLPLLSQVSKNKIYIISFGAWIYHTDSRTFTPLSMPKESQGNSAALKLAYTNEEFSLLQQSNIAYIVDQQTNNVRYLFETIDNEEITSMTYNPENRTVWIGTNHGLGYYQMEQKEYKRLPTGMFNSVSYLTMDLQGRLWICAENKLFSYNLQEEAFTSWNKSDGYLPNEIQSNFQTTRMKDFIYLNGSQGLVRIATSIESTSQEAPQVYLSEVHYNGKTADSLIENNQLEIPWDYHSLVLSLGIKSEDIFQKNLLKYTVRSSSGEYSFESYEPQLNLSSLSPDKYSLWVSCYNKDGNENPSVQLLTLLVSPPWYQSSWFLTFAGIFIIGFTAGCARWMHLKKTRQMKGDVGEFLQTVLHSLNKEDEMEKEASGIAEIPAPQPVLNEADKTFLEKMDKLIQDNLSNEELSAKFLTDHLAMSRASLYNKVKALTGMGVNDYINRIRIERSMYLLTNTDMSINEISYEVGFSYPRYFSTSFKQVKGMTPTRFKEENKKKTMNE